MQEILTCLRLLRTTALTGALFTILLFVVGRSWFLGYAVGAFLSVFSLFSLAVVVPLLFRPGVGGGAQGLLTLTLFLKLPLYCAGLYLVTRGKGMEPIAAVFGIGLAPTVITLRALGSILQERVRAPHRVRTIVSDVSDSVSPAMHVSKGPQRSIVRSRCAERQQGVDRPGVWEA